MNARRQVGPVRVAFEDTSLRMDLTDILPLRMVSADVVKSAKYAQIAASIEEVGIIEPPVVVRDKKNHDKFLLLDGHLRIDILKRKGVTHTVCLIAKDDEAYTYNKRVNRIAVIQEHLMILKAIEKGVPEDRLARALNVDVSSIRQKRNLLKGICPEVVEMLKDRHVPVNTIGHLRKLKSVRQIEAVELMIAMNRFTISYAASLVAATPAAQLVDRRKPTKGLGEIEIGMMERESAALDREFKTIEQDYGSDHLDLVLAVAYVAHLLTNARVVGYLARHFPDILGEFQKIADLQKAA
ncbi:plasmid partitioning protein RepB C-terminal domain-containing protein [uncultured Aureimonas sp.]|uniref:plasmid partitioning protein RepB C-terminal domain-containing protein n=1 Tax=uncultured Aureimonas sp. TaxID=1604662 RepID=UPI0025DBDDEF|nr:plasmid partitioning protein RepB C-terminal domain-containing protein [uncultured Aureimonas sp.]